MDEKKEDKSEESKKNHIVYYRSLTKIITNMKNEINQEGEPAIKEHLHALGIHNDIQLQKALLSGHLDYQKSRLNEQPRPIHVFQFRPTLRPKLQVTAACIWYKDKIKVYSLSEERLTF